MTLALLHTLHENPGLTFHRVGEALRVIPAVPPEARPTLAHFKAALLQALEDGEGWRPGPSSPPGGSSPFLPTPWGWRPPWC
jgi:hypothetical protein